MAMSIVILIVILIFIVISYFRHLQMRKRYPPGPWSFPFVGLLPFQVLQLVFARFLPKVSQAKYYREMREKYGDIWALDFGSQRLVVLASHDLITEAYVENGKLFSGRPRTHTLKILNEDRGILVDGEVCQGNRSLAIKALRDLGMGKQILEKKICLEVEKLIENIENNLLIPKDSPTLFVKSVSNIISELVFNVRNKYNDPDFESYIKNIFFIAHSSSAPPILEIFTNFLPIKYTGKIFPEVDKFLKSCSLSLQFITDKCKARMKIEGEFSKPGCVFDYFWRYRYQDQPEIGSEERLLDISHSMFDLFIAGTDTTTNLLGFCCLVLGHDQNLQEELRKEIQLLADDYKLINMEMRKDCPKLLSFIDEVQRYSYLVQFIDRRALQPCLFQGYRIEPNDIIYGDIGTTTRDPKIFENPDVFNAYRFMDESRTKYIPNKCLIPFGIGKRACIGESITMMESFLFLSKLIHKFNISLTSQTEINYSTILEGETGIVHAPVHHEIIFQLIQQQ